MHLDDRAEKDEHHAKPSCGNGACSQVLNAMNTPPRYRAKLAAL
jgi:hypothetical protein